MGNLKSTAHIQVGKNIVAVETQSGLHIRKTWNGVLYVQAAPFATIEIMVGNESNPVTALNGLFVERTPNALLMQWGPSANETSQHAAIPPSAIPVPTQSAPFRSDNHTANIFQRLPSATRMAQYI